MAQITLPHSSYRLVLDVWVHKQYPAENRTEFHAVLALVDATGWGAWSGWSASWTVRSPYSNTLRSGTISGYDFSNTNRIELARFIQSYPHNADGTFSPRQWSGVFADHASGVIGSGRVDIASLGAPKINRATTPTVSGGFTSGSSATISFSSRALTTYTHDVSYSIGTKSGSINTGVGASTTWTPPHTLFTESPNSATAQIKLTTVTKDSGGTVVGTTDTNIPFTLAASQVPTPSAVTWTDQNTTVKNNIGGFVQSLSTVRGVVARSDLHGASITSKRLIVAGASIAENTDIHLASAGTITASGEATDSRGRVGTKAANLTVLAYTPPKLGANGWSVRRANSSNAVDSAGQYLRVDLHAIVQSLPVGTEKNALKVKVITQPTDGAPADRNVFTHGSLTHNTAFQVQGGAVFLAAKSYYVTVEVTDNTGNKLTLTDLVTTAGATLDMNGNAVGVGKLHERGALDVAGIGYFSGEVYAAGIAANNRLVRKGETATESATGLVERATQAEVNTGTDTTRYVSPATLANKAFDVQTLTRTINDVISATSAAEFQITILNTFAITLTRPTWYRFTYQAWKGGASELRVGIELSGATTRNYTEPTWGVVVREIGEGNIFTEQIALLGTGTTNVHIKGYKIGTQNPNVSYQQLTAYPLN